MSLIEKMVYSMWNDGWSVKEIAEALDLQVYHVIDILRDNNK